MIFVDSNIPMYAAGAASPQKEACIALLDAVANGRCDVVSSSEVLQEILHRYRAIDRLTDGLRVYDLFRALPLRWLAVTPEDVDSARHLLAMYHSLSSRDALHMAVMHAHQIRKIVTYDRGFLGKADVTVCLPEQVIHEL